MLQLQQCVARVLRLPSRQCYTTIRDARAWGLVSRDTLRTPHKIILVSRHPHSGEDRLDLHVSTIATLSRGLDSYLGIREESHDLHRGDFLELNRRAL